MGLPWIALDDADQLPRALATFACVQVAFLRSLGLDRAPGGLGSQLEAYPALLTLSLESNLRPTVAVLRRAGLLERGDGDEGGEGGGEEGGEEGGEGGGEGGSEGGGEGGREGDGGEVRRSAPAARRTALRPRHLAASLEERVLPRLAFHDALRRRALGSQSAGAEAMAAEVRLTLSSVTVISDASFAKFVGAKPDEYANFRRELLARKRPTGLQIDWLPEDFDLTPLVSPELE